MSLEAAKIPNESNQNQKPNYQVRGDLYVDKSPKKEIEKRTEFDQHTRSQEKHDEVTDSTSTERPVCGSETTERCVLTPKHVQEDIKQVRGDPYWWIKRGARN